MQFVAAAGTVQMTILLSIIYWVVIPPMAIPLKLFGDPLNFRASRHVGWQPRSAVADMTAAMTRQY